MKKKKVLRSLHGEGNFGIIVKLISHKITVTEENFFFFEGTEENFLLALISL